MGFSSDFLQAAGPISANRLSAAVQSWADIWRLPGLPNAVEITRNPRLRSTVARYVRDKQIIEVGPRFFTLRARMVDLLAHEMAHAAVDIKYGNVAKPHGEEWQSLITAVGLSPRAQLTTTAARPRSSIVAPPTKYSHRCPVCHMVRLSRRPIARWRCRSCVEDGLTGTLEIARLPSKT